MPPSFWSEGTLSEILSGNLLAMPQECHFFLSVPLEEYCES